MALNFKNIAFSPFFFFFNLYLSLSLPLSMCFFLSCLAGEKFFFGCCDIVFLKQEWTSPFFVLFTLIYFL